MYKEHVFQNLSQVANQNFLLENIEYSLKEEINENSLIMKDLQVKTNYNNHTLNEKEMLITIESVGSENAEVNINKLENLLEKKDTEIKERDASIESLTNDLESSKSYHGVIEQSKTINSPDSDFGILNNAVHINQKDDSQKKRKFKTVKNEKLIFQIFLQ